MLVLLLACAAPTEQTLLSYDASRTGADGGDGPFGVALRSLEGANPRYDLVLPIGEDGAPAATGTAAATFVFLQGGFVAPERYHWFGAHLASRGATVLYPHFGLDLALLSPGAVGRTLDQALERDDLALAGAPVAVGGHSLGGVAAAQAWIDDPRFEAALILASYPAEGADVESVTEGTVLSLAGTSDAKTPLDDARAGAARFVAPSAFGTIQGMTHYAWTDDATESEPATDDTDLRPDAETRRDALRAIDAWMDACVTGVDPGAWAAFEASVPETVEIEDGPPCGGEE
jgi:hypothetical protein